MLDLETLPPYIEKTNLIHFFHMTRTSLCLFLFRCRVTYEDDNSEAKKLDASRLMVSRRFKEKSQYCEWPQKLSFICQQRLRHITTFTSTIFSIRLNRISIDTILHVSLNKDLNQEYIYMSIHIKLTSWKSFTYRIQILEIRRLQSNPHSYISHEFYTCQTGIRTFSSIVD